MTSGLHKNIVLQPCPEAGGYGLFCTAHIEEGELVYDDCEDNKSKIWTFADVAALPKDASEILEHFLYQIGIDQFRAPIDFELLPMDQWKNARIPASFYMNHSV